jgi:calcineurin-like phosphoesterase family protein
VDIWLISDTHFDHINILKYENRPFDNHLEMTESLIDNWNSVVKPNDLIFHLGDIFFCNSDRMKYISSKLNGRKILIRGNHDKGMSNGKFRNLGFDVFNYYFMDDFLFSHYPQHEQPLKIAVESGILRGNVHGHVHSQIEGLNQDIYRCVSVELINYTPINFEDVKNSFV